jgi:hypothetical protein
VVGPEGLSESREINAMRCQTPFDDPKPRLALRGECQTPFDDPKPRLALRGECQTSSARIATTCAA